VYNYETLNTRL